MANSVRKRFPPNRAADTELIERTVGGLTVVLARSVSPYARKEAARALRHFESPSTTMALVQALSDSTVRTAAANSLVAFGPDVVPVLVEALQDETQRRYLIEVLPRFGPDAADAVPALVSILENDDAHRDLAAEALGAVGPSAATAIPAVLAVYEDVLDPDWARDVTRDEGGAIEGDVQEISRFGAKRRRRIAALGALVGMEHRPTILIVIDDRLSPRELKAAAVRKLGADDVDLLVTALGDHAEAIRTAAADTLGVLGEAARPAIPKLAETLGDLKPAVRDVAASALGQLALCCAGDVQRAVDEAIERCGSWGMLTAAPLERIGPPVVTGCLNAIDHEEAACRVLAAVTLVRLDATGDEAIGALQSALQDNDVAVRQAVVTELLEHPEVTLALGSAVLERFTDPDTTVRETAVHLTRGTPTSRPPSAGRWAIPRAVSGYGRRGRFTASSRSMRTRSRRWSMSWFTEGSSRARRRSGRWCRPPATTRRFAPSCSPSWTCRTPGSRGRPPRRSARAGRRASPCSSAGWTIRRKWAAPQRRRTGSRPPDPPPPRPRRQCRS